jgi:hypothetical protein
LIGDSGIEKTRRIDWRNSGGGESCRTSVIEALKKLEFEGFVIIIPKKGIMIRDLAIKEITEIVETRAALECLTITKLAMKFTPLVTLCGAD